MYDQRNQDIVSGKPHYCCNFSKFNSPPVYWGCWGRNISKLGQINPPNSAWIDTISFTHLGEPNLLSVYPYLHKLGVSCEHCVPALVCVCVCFQVTVKQSDHSSHVTDGCKSDSDAFCSFQRAGCSRSNRLQYVFNSQSNDESRPFSLQANLTWSLIIHQSAQWLKYLKVGCCFFIWLIWDLMFRLEFLFLT